jgi:hypothetical protein
MFSFLESKTHAYCFGVNPLGEVFINGEYVLGSVNISRCAVESLSPKDYKEWSAFKQNDRHDELEKKVQKACDYEFERQLHEQLNVFEYGLAKQINELQSVDDGRWRVYGGMSGNSVHDAVACINLVTEFRNFVGEDFDDYWKKLSDIASKLGAEVRTLDEGEEMEHSWKTDENGQKIPGSEKFGKNHGRQYRQVEVIWNVTNKSLLQVKRMIKNLNDKLQEVWEETGVGIC